MRDSRFRWFLVIAAIVLLVIVWYVWGLDWLAERRWQAYVAEARARGVKFSLEEMRPPRVALEDDLSVSAIFIDAGEGALGALAKDAFQIPFRLNLEEPQGCSHLPDWPATRQELAKSDSNLLTAEADDLRAIGVGVKKFEPLLDCLLRNRRKSGNWNKLWKELWVVDPTSTQIRGCTQLLRIHAHLKIASKHAREARSIVEAQFRLMTCLATAPGLQLDYARHILHQNVCSGIGYGLELDVWRDEDLQDLIHGLCNLNPIEWHRWALQTERAFAVEFCAKTIGDPEIIMGTNIGSSTESGVIERFKPSWLYRHEVSRKSWWRNNELWLQRYFDQEIESLPAGEGIWRPRVNRTYDPLTAEVPELKLAVLMASGIESWRILAVTSQIRNGCATIACALELHRRKNGEYSASLEALVPRFLPKLPLDPCSGEPFRYRLTGENYLLYSVGTDRMDDGGESTERGKTGDARWWAPRRN